MLMAQLLREFGAMEAFFKDKKEWAEGQQAE
jgi:hypothetical protein